MSEKQRTLDLKYDTSEKGDHSYALDQDKNTKNAMQKVFEGMKAFAKEKNDGYPMVEISFFSKMGTVKNPRSYRLWACPIDTKDGDIAYILPCSGKFQKYHKDKPKIATSSISAVQIVLGLTSYFALKKQIDDGVITEEKEKKAVEEIMKQVQRDDDLTEKMGAMIKDIFKKGKVNGNLRRQEYGLNGKFVTRGIVFRSMTKADRETVFSNNYSEIFKWSEDRCPFIANLTDLKSYIIGGDKNTAVPFVFGTKKEKASRGAKETAEGTKKARISNADLRGILDGVHDAIASDPRNKDLNIRALSLLSLGEKIRENAVIKAGETQFAIIFKNKDMLEGDDEDVKKEKKDKKKKSKKRKNRDENSDKKKKEDDSDDDGDGEEKPDSTDNNGDSHMDEPGNAESSDSETSDMDSSSSDSDGPSDAVEPVPDKTSPKKPYNIDFYKNTEYNDTASLKSVVMKSFKNSSVSEHVKFEDVRVQSATPPPSPRQEKPEKIEEVAVDVAMEEVAEEDEVQLPNSPSMNMIPASKPDCTSSVSVPSPTIAELASPSLTSPAPQISELVPVTSSSFAVQTSDPSIVATTIAEPQAPTSKAGKPMDPVTEKVIQTVALAMKINKQTDDINADLKFQTIEHTFNKKMETMQQNVDKKVDAMQLDLVKIQSNVDELAKQSKETQTGIFGILQLLQDQRQRTTEVQASVNNYTQKHPEKLLDPGPLFIDPPGMTVEHPLQEFSLFD